jgi:hypothetical protein
MASSLGEGHARCLPFCFCNTSSSWLGALLAVQLTEGV